MRSEQEVLDSLLTFANEEENVRVVSLNGSRVNLNSPPDKYRDYDIVFAVGSADRFVTDQSWISRFGQLVIKQQLQNPMSSGAKVCQTFLMQFDDGVRIDLSFKPLEYLTEIVFEDTLTKILLDKDNRLEQLAPPDDSGWFIRKPSEKQYDEALNEIWWLQAYVAKGLCRDELPYARHTFTLIMEQVELLLSWDVGIRNDWQVNIGAYNKWLKRYLPREIYEEYLQLLPSADYEQFWLVLANAGALSRKIGTAVAEKLGFEYPLQDDINVTKYLQQLKAGDFPAAKQSPSHGS